MSNIYKQSDVTLWVIKCISSENLTGTSAEDNSFPETFITFQAFHDGFGVKLTLCPDKKDTGV